MLSGGYQMRLNSGVWGRGKKSWKEGDSGIRHMTDEMSIASEACLDLWQGACGVWPPKPCAHWSIGYLNPPKMDGPQLLWESMRALNEESWCLLPMYCCFSTVTGKSLIGDGIEKLPAPNQQQQFCELIGCTDKALLKVTRTWRGTTIQPSQFFFFSPWEMICNTLPLQLFQLALVQ